MQNGKRQFKAFKSSNNACHNSNCKTEHSTWRTVSHQRAAQRCTRARRQARAAGVAESVAARRRPSRSVRRRADCKHTRQPTNAIALKHQVKWDTQFRNAWQLTSWFAETTARWSFIPSPRPLKKSVKGGPRAYPTWLKRRFLGVNYILIGL